MRSRPPTKRAALALIDDLMPGYERYALGVRSLSVAPHVDGYVVFFKVAKGGDGEPLRRLIRLTPGLHLPAESHEQAVGVDEDAAHVIHIWDLPQTLRVGFTEVRRRRLQRIAHDLHGPGTIKHWFAKNTHRGNRPGVYPSSAPIGGLRSLLEEAGEDLAAVEADVTHVFAQSRDSSMAGPFPKRFSEAWAWLFGAFFGGGGIFAREQQLRLRVDSTCLTQVEAVGQRIAAPAQPISHGRSPRIPRREVTFPRPVLECLRLWGLPEPVRCGALPGRRPATRVQHLQVPSIVAERASWRRAFVEGYLATSAAQASTAIAWRGDRTYTSARIQINIRGRTRDQVEAFRSFVAAVLTEGNTPVHLRPTMPKNGGYAAGIWVVGNGNVTQLLRSFDVRRTRILEVTQEEGISCNPVELS